MYGKEEFIERLREKEYYNTLLEWLEWFSNPDALREIHRRHDDMPDNMPECYVVECAKWYVQVKMCDVQDFVFRKNGMKAEEEVYHYPPYHPGAFLATLYAIFATDPYRWTADDDKFYKLEKYMKENGYGKFYSAIRTILDRNELPKRPRVAGRAAFSIAGNRKQVENVKEPKPSKEPQSVSSNDEVALSVLFSQELLTNESNRMAFVKVIRDVVTPKVLDTSGSREAKWKWPHVQQALYDSKHIVTLNNKNEFGRSMSPITGCTATSISQTFKRFDAKDTDANIILAIRKVVDNAIATKKDVIEKSAKGSTDVQTSMNPVLKQLLEPILLLEPYYYPNCTKEMVIEGFQSLSRKYVPEHFVDVEKRIRKTSFNFITALQEVRFIRDNVPALEMGFHLKQLYDDLQPKDICRGLMNSVDERLPESVNMLLTQFRFDMQHIMKKANARIDEVEEVETDARRQYIEYLNAKEENLIEILVRKTLCFSPFFQHYVMDSDVWEMYTRLFKEISLVASVHRVFDESRIDTAVCKVVGVLREVGIIKEGVPTRQLAECFKSTGLHYDSIKKAITVGFDRDRMLHDFIYDFWMRKYLPD